MRSILLTLTLSAALLMPGIAVAETSDHSAAQGRRHGRQVALRGLTFGLDARYKPREVCKAWSSERNGPQSTKYSRAFIRSCTRTLREHLR